MHSCSWVSFILVNWRIVAVSEKDKFNSEEINYWRYLNSGGNGQLTLYCLNYFFSSFFRDIA